MRSAILLLVLSAAIFSSCTSAYKTGQTPDDVYFSPERPQDKYVTAREEDNRYESNDYYYDDQYLRMKVHNRTMWSQLDDPYFYNPSYSYMYYDNWSNPWSPYTSWNYYYNPYCSPVIYNPKTVIASNNHPRIFNMNTYNNAQLTNNNYANPKGGLNNNSYNYSSRPVRIVGYTPSNNNSGSGAGNFLRNIFNNSSNNSSSSGSSNSSFSSGSRSSSGGSGSSGSSGGGGGGSAPVRRF